MTQQRTSPPAQAPSRLEQHVAHFQWRVLQDALTEATSDHWERRAQAFEWARPRRGDFHGQVTTRDRALKHRELTNLATNCRRYAALVRETGLDADARAMLAEALIEHVRQVA